MTDRIPRFPRSLTAAALAGAVLLAGTLTPLRAQAPQGFWNTSAEPPAGLPPALLSAPDTLIPPGMDEQLDRPAVEPGPGQWRVTGSALKPRENDVSYSVNSSGSCTYATAGDVGTVWNIEPQVPNGAIVSLLRLYFYDTSAVNNSTAWFSVYDVNGNFVQEWSVSSNTSGGNGFNDSATIGHRIDYSLYSYLLNWRPGVVGGSMQLCGLQLFYDTPLVVPGAPLGLAAAVSGHTVSLAWNPPGTGGPASGYVLEAGSAPGLANLANTPVTSPGFVAGGIPSGVYYVRVRAINAAGPGAATPDVTVVVP